MPNILSDDTITMRIYGFLYGMRYIRNLITLFKGIDASFTHLARELGKLDLAYIHIVDHSTMGAPEVPMSIKSAIRTAFDGTIIISGGLNKTKAEAVLESGHGELTAFGTDYISNPDLVHRLKNDIPLTEADSSTFYTQGPKGYIDYPTAQKQKN